MSAKIIETSDLPPPRKAGNVGTNGSLSRSNHIDEIPGSQAPDSAPSVTNHLQSLEAEIKRNRGRSLLIGRDLKTIRDQKLYRSTGQTWNKYCQARFRFGKRAADYHVSAWLAANICGIPDDYSPRSLRPLTKLAPERQKQAWAEATGKTKKERPSARDIKIAVSHLAGKRMTEWTLRAATAVHQHYFKVGLARALAGANEEQTREYCDRLHEYSADWAERHSSVPLQFHVETALNRVQRLLKAEFERWPKERHQFLFDRMAQVFSPDG